MWTDRQQKALEALKACLISAPILGFPTEKGRFVLDMDVSLFAVGGGGLNQIQDDREVVIAYASRSLRLSQRRYCTTRRKMLAAVVMCTHFRSYLRGAQFTLRTDHIYLRWLQKFRNEDGMLARWYLLLGQFSVTFEYRPGAQYANADGMSRQCGQCQRPDCPVSASDREVVIAYASRSFRLSQRRYCVTRREILTAVVMCTHFQSYLQGAQFTLRTDHISLRWLQKFRNEDGMLAHWYLLLGQFSVTFEYRPGAQYANADGMSRQCGQRPDCPVSASDSQVAERDAPQALEEQPFASSEMGESMDTDLLPELSGETWVASTLLDGLTADLLPAGADMDLIVASRQGNVPLWADCTGFSPKLRCWRLQVGNLSIDTDGRLWRRRAPPSGASQLVVPHSERRDMIRRFHDSLFAGHLGVSRSMPPSESSVLARFASGCANVPGIMYYLSGA